MTILRSPAAQAVYDAERARRGESDTFIRTPAAIEAWEQEQAKQHGYKLPPLSTAKVIDRRIPGTSRLRPISQYEYWTSGGDDLLDRKNREKRKKILSAIHRGVPPENIKNMNKLGYDADGNPDWSLKTVLPLVLLVVFTFLAMASQ